MKTAIVDMDGTICEEKPTFERSLARPLPGAVDGVKRLKAAGYTVIVYTARGWGEYAMTHRWLKENNIWFDVLLCGKPIGDIWIDDRAINFRGWEQI
jgi:histidinol phosphatase-like enzyme